MPAAAAAAIERVIDPGSLALSIFHNATDGPAASDRTITSIVEACPDQTRLETLVAETAGRLGIATPLLTVCWLPADGWAARSIEDHQPIRLGRFFIHGSHERAAAPRWSLRIDAGVAFGTGRHESTSGALLAIDRLARRRRYRRALDIGTGSGVLALAMARLFRRPVVATDIDQTAVDVARGNAAINRLTPFVQLLVTDGFRHPAIASGGPYDLIVMNILLQPIVAMAPDCTAELAAGGHLVLSGLLRSQTAAVIARYRALGLVLGGRIAIGEWETLVLQRLVR